MIGLNEGLVGDSLLRFAQIANLREKTDWQAVVLQLEDEQAAKLKRMQADLLHTTAFDQREVDFLRGWVNAAKFFKNMPDNASRRYKTLKAQEERKSL